jgi:ATP-dependent Clp protease ATP-binding subunit ClpC
LNARSSAAADDRAFVAKGAAMFERFTEEARRAVFFARYQASFQSAGEITAGHILIGVMREAESRSVAASFLKGHEANIRSALSIPSPSGKPQIDLKRDIPLDRNAKMVLAYAIKEAELDESFYVLVDHLLFGLLRFPNEAADALQSISLDLAKARAASKLIRTKYPSKKTLYHRLFGRPSRAHRDRLIKLLAFVVVCSLGVLLIRLLN